MNIEEKIITVNDLSVKVVRKKIKNLHLAVYPPNGWVRIAVPEIIDDKAVHLAIVSRLSWIKRQIKRFQDQPRESSRELVTGESHYYLGQRYLLNVIPCEKRPFVEIQNKKRLTLHVKENHNLLQRKKLLNNWYRNEMKKVLPQIIEKWELKLNLKVHSYGIKRMKTKWGSCNPKHRRIWLNLELIKKPMNCLEYVVVHEIIHFLESKHDQNFRAHMDKAMPQWRTIKKELNSSLLAHENWKF